MYTKEWTLGHSLKMQRTIHSLCYLSEVFIVYQLGADTLSETGLQHFAGFLPPGTTTPTILCGICFAGADLDHFPVDTLLHTPHKGLMIEGLHASSLSSLFHEYMLHFALFNSRPHMHSLYGLVDFRSRVRVRGP